MLNYIAPLIVPMACSLKELSTPDVDICKRTSSATLHMMLYQSSWNGTYSRNSYRLFIFEGPQYLDVNSSSFNLIQVGGEAMNTQKCVPARHHPVTDITMPLGSRGTSLRHDVQNQIPT